MNATFGVPENERHEPGLTPPSPSSGGQDLFLQGTLKVALGSPREGNTWVMAFVLSLQPITYMLLSEVTCQIQHLIIIDEVPPKSGVAFRLEPFRAGFGDLAFLLLRVS